MTTRPSDMASAIASAIASAVANGWHATQRNETSLIQGNPIRNHRYARPCGKRLTNPQLREDVTHDG